MRARRAHLPRRAPTVLLDQLDSLDSVDSGFALGGGVGARDLLVEAQTSGEPFDLIIADLAMPEVNGIQMMQELMKQDEISKRLSSGELPVLFISLLNNITGILTRFMAASILTRLAGSS